MIRSISHLSYRTTWSSACIALFLVGPKASAVEPIPICTGVARGAIALIQEDPQTHQITRERCQLNGKLEGPARNFTPQGELVLEGAYSQGKMTGIWRRWFANKKPRDEGSWSNGVPVGTWKRWHEKTEALTETHYDSQGKAQCQDPPDSTQNLLSCSHEYLTSDRRFFGLIRLEQMALLQESGGVSTSPSLGGDLRIRLSRWFSVAALVDQNVIVAAASPRYVGLTQLSAELALSRISFFWIGVSFGGQWWWNQVRPQPIASLHLAFQLPRPILWVREIQGSVSSVYFSGDMSYQAKIGIGVPL